MTCFPFLHLFPIEAKDARRRRRSHTLSCWSWFSAVSCLPLRRRSFCSHPDHGQPVCPSQQTTICSDVAAASAGDHSSWASSFFLFRPWGRETVTLGSEKLASYCWMEGVCGFFFVWWEFKTTSKNLSKQSKFAILSLSITGKCVQEFKTTQHNGTSKHHRTYPSGDEDATKCSTVFVVAG